MSKHTPGRLFLSELPVGERDGKMAYAKLEIVAPSQDPRYLVFSVARIEFSYEQKHKGFISTSKEEAEANARRLVACWNACEGIATDELEEIARIGGMLGPREDVAKIAEQRDELREALQSIAEYWNRDQNETAMADACWHAIETAMAAIAKATGDQQ